VNQKGIRDKVEPKIEVVSPIAQKLKRAESDVKRLKEEGKPMPHEPTFIYFKPQSMSGVQPSGKRSQNVVKAHGKDIK
jgi:hypothetical protein